MAILKIARMGHPVLLQRSEEVADPTAPEIKQLVSDMIETMDDADGRGLAANQVYVNQRVVVFHPPADPPTENNDEEAEERGQVLALINPEIEVLDEKTEEGWEGCLSVPELRGVVPRHIRIRYSGTTPDGERIEREASGYHARVVQHEFDHLDGILYPMRMEDLGLLVFNSEFDHFMAAHRANDAEQDDVDDNAPDRDG
jgi:peptide deformylase